MISMVFGILATGVIFYISLLYHSVSLALLGYASLVLLGLSWLFLRYRAAKVTCSLQIPIAIAECGVPVNVQLSVQNSSFLPCTRLKYCLGQNSRLLRKKRAVWIRSGTALPGENLYDHTLVFENYGSYELHLKKVRVYDLTGLFYIKKKINSKGVIQVLPNMQEIGVQLTEATRNFFGDADSYDPDRPGYDCSELFQIRPFQKGDKIQSIHWKLSMKFDDLLVRENSMPKACPVLFFLDFQKQKQKHAQRGNAYLAAMASISYSLMDAGCPHYAVWYNGKDAMRMRVDDEESLYVFLRIYLEEPFQAHTKDLLGAYQEKYRGEPYLHTVSLNEKLEVKKNGEKIAGLAGADWEEKLRGLELVL